MESIFQTSDPGLAAYLFARAHPGFATKNQQGTIFFIFPREAESSAEAFYFGASMPAKALVNALKQLEVMKESIQ